MFGFATKCQPRLCEKGDTFRRVYPAVLSILVLSSLSARSDNTSVANSAQPTPGVTTQAASPALSFFIKRYQIKGASNILTRTEIEEAVYPFLGPERTPNDVEGARSTLEKMYQAKGYQTVSVQIPPQHVANGVVVLQVVEEKVGRLRVNGARYYLPSEIKSEAPSLAEGTVPNFNDVTHDIVGLNQQPDRRVTPAIRASDTPGFVDIDLNVKDSPPLSASVELNNRYSEGTTPLRLNTTVSYDNLWQLGHSASFTYQVAPEDPNDAEVFSGSYLARIPNVSWLSFLVYGLKSDSNVATVGSINVAGKGDVVGLRAIMTLPTLRETGFYHSISLGFDYKDFEQDEALGAGSDIETPITYYPFSITYSGALQDKLSLTQFDLGLTFGIDGMGSTPAQFDAKGFGTAANFFYFRGDISRTQELPWGLQGYAKIQGQVADQPLVNSEQFSAGGLDTVRGYLESEVLGDNGAVGQFELRTPSLEKWLGSSVNEWRFYAFGDAAYVTVNDPLPEVTSVFDLASTGVGTRLKLFDHLNGSLDLAFPLIDGPNTKAFDPVLTFKVSASY